MPKLYHHGGAWQVPGRQDRRAIRVDVPNAPPELAAWLNDRRVSDVAIKSLEELETEYPTAEPFRLGPPTKEPPRVAPAFLGDVASGAEFIPVTKAAEIDRLLARCPMCHNSEDAAQHRRDRLDFEGVRAWIAERATKLEIDELADLVEEKRQ